MTKVTKLWVSERSLGLGEALWAKEEAIYTREDIYTREAYRACYTREAYRVCYTREAMGGIYTREAMGAYTPGRLT